MTAETTRIWMYENRERWNEYQRNYYQRKKAKVHEYQRNCQMIRAGQDSAMSAGTADKNSATVESDA